MHFQLQKSTPLWVKAAWTIALVVTVNVYAGGYRFIVDRPYRLGDFFQEWASARNHFEGLPVYTPQQITAWRYLGVVPDTTKQIFVQMNGHPPPCVLLALPFGKLDYAVALWLWNGLSVAALLVAAAIVLRREVGTVRTWYWLPVLTIAFGNPMMQHVILGQLTTWILLLIVGAIAAEQRSRPGLAGILLGTATAIKLYPGLLFIYFLAKRQNRALLFGFISFAVWHVATMAILGTQAYRDYVLYAMPEVLRYRDWWANYSITGMWYKLFDCSSGQAVPLWYSPTTAKIGSLVSNAAVVCSAMYLAVRARKRADARPLGLVVATIAMVLVSPIAWDHYFLLLLWPLVWLGRELPGRAIPFVLAILAVLWLNPLVLFNYAVHSGRATPQEILGPISAPFYGVIALYVFAVRQALRGPLVHPAPVISAAGPEAAFTR